MVSIEVAVALIERGRCGAKNNLGFTALHQAFSDGHMSAPNY
jgi:hypothetical protein